MLPQIATRSPRQSERLFSAQATIVVQSTTVPGAWRGLETSKPSSTMKEQNEKKAVCRDQKSRRKNSISRKGKKHKRVAKSSDLRPMGEACALKRFAKVYTANWEKLVRRGRRRGLRDAEDAVQDAFLSVPYATHLTRMAIQYIPKRHADRTSTFLRRQTRRGDRELPLLETIWDIWGAPDPDIEGIGLKDEVAELLSRLSPSAASVLTEFYLEEQSIEEVAEIMGVSPEAIKSRLFRARESARRVLRELRGIPKSQGTE